MIAMATAAMHAKTNALIGPPPFSILLISGVSNARAANQGAGVLHIHGLCIHRPPSFARRCARYSEQSYAKSKNDRRAYPRGEMPPSHCGLPP